jgi:hypothetical protein
MAKAKAKPNESLYRYTLLKQDGTTKELKPSPRKDLSEMYKILNCTTIEIIPKAYYQHKDYGACVIWGDEEARFKSTNKRNPHFETLMDADTQVVFDIVGDVLLERKA